MPSSLEPAHYNQRHKVTHPLHSDPRRLLAQTWQPNMLHGRQ
jgi:hypothetical protein